MLTSLINVIVLSPMPTFHYWTQPTYKISWIYINPRLTYFICFKFKMAPVHHVWFSIIWLLTYISPYIVDFPSLYKICCKNFDRRPNYGPETKFKMAAAAILNLLPVAIFNILPTLHYRCQPPYKISCKYLTPRLNYNNFLKFKMATVRHLGFSKTWFLSNGSPWGADFPSLYQIWCKNVDRRRNYGPKSKSKMVAVRHLGFVTSSYRTTREVFLLGHIGLSNFMVIRCIVLQIWRFEFFADLAWNAYSRPKNFGYWGSEHLNVIDQHRDPQKAHPWSEPHAHTCQFWYRSVHWCDLCATKS